MIRLMISGILGNMGSRILELCFEQSDIEVVAGVDRQDGRLVGIPLYRDPSSCRKKIDVVVDFSHPDFTEKLTRYCAKTKTPLVLCTTGQRDLHQEMILALSREIPVFQSANMSVGIALLRTMAQKAAILLNQDFDIEIVERHHNHKVDAPSGTALMLADQINAVCAGRYTYTFDRHNTLQRRSRDEIGLHAIRGGTIVGEHEVIFAGSDEVITLSHSATSRTVFAVGALNAIRFLSRQKKPGLYDMDAIMTAIF